MHVNGLFHGEDSSDEQAIAVWASTPMPTSAPIHSATSAGNPRTRGPPWRGGPVGDGRGHTRVGGTVVRHGVDCHVAADDGCRGRCFESRRRCEGGACANTGRRPAGGGVALAAGLPRLSLLS